MSREPSAPGEQDLAAVEARLDEGDPEGAVRLLRGLAGGDLGAAPMPIPALAAEALLLGDDPAGAERIVLAGLSRAPGDPDLLVWKAAAEYRLWKFREAAESARLALAADADVAYAHQVRGLACDHLGRRDEATAHLARASRLDPDAFPPEPKIPREAFDRVVRETVEDVRRDQSLAKVLEEVAVVVEDLPSEAVHRAGADDPDLLGFFAGRSLADRAADSGGWGPGPGAPHPGTLYLFRKNLMRACRDRAELAEEIRVTVLHELAHLLGFDEEEMEGLGLE
ncbi:MAG: metallopeptidase family protein [Planctomycetales bacterium]|nr:metallopeptidase family protein [Planctomycetales bacterium]